MCTSRSNERHFDYRLDILRIDTTFKHFNITFRLFEKEEKYDPWVFLQNHNQTTIDAPNISHEKNYYNMKVFNGYCFYIKRSSPAKVHKIVQKDVWLKQVNQGTCAKG